MNALVATHHRHADWQRLFDSPVRVFGLLDFACSPLLYETLEPHLDSMQCLYEGMARARLGRYAPHVYEAHPAHPAFQLWASRGIGHAWGVFLQTPLDMHALCKHLRKFLFVVEPDGSRTYFRYYDPHVMHDLMATLYEPQKQAMFKNIHAVIAESESDRLTRYDMRHGLFGMAIAESLVFAPESGT
jgi:hypothetical protein